MPAAQTAPTHSAAMLAGASAAPVASIEPADGTAAAGGVAVSAFFGVRGRRLRMSAAMLAGDSPDSGFEGAKFSRVDILADFPTSVGFCGEE